MSALEQYGLLLGLVIGIVGVVLCLYGLARSVGPVRPEPGKDVPASAGVLSRDPVWSRYRFPAHYVPGHLLDWEEIF
ncbi:MAG: hypothetical protein KBO59_26480, partial [Achromobacter sp.]|nr:hypothetical protein [Achromobacter sp.]